jgi:hypothetical protein
MEQPATGHCPRHSCLQPTPCRRIGLLSMIASRILQSLPPLVNSILASAPRSSPKCPSWSTAPCVQPITLHWHVVVSPTTPGPLPTASIPELAICGSMPSPTAPVSPPMIRHSRVRFTDAWGSAQSPHLSIAGSKPAITARRTSASGTPLAANGSAVSRKATTAKVWKFWQSLPTA